MSEPIVKIEEGRLKGKISQDHFGSNFYSFLGIPYAKPPIGELRFKAPLPVDPWDDLKDATKEGDECPSLHMFFAYNIGSENNCLNLNVHTRQLPTNGAEELKPVMVYIHGGAFLYGCNKSELFGPDYLMTEDVVLVIINYRLGVLGFLSLEDSTLEVPGNAGLKDMVLALKWVQRNIRHFNGDPNNVTIFGESAGAACVHYLYLSPLCKGLFHKAIAQSGCAFNSWARGKSNGHEIAKYMGCKEKDESKILEHLQASSVTKIVKAQHKVLDLFTPDSIRPFGPVIEKPSSGAFLSEEPLEIIKAGTFNKVPLMMGYTSKEGIFFEIVRKLVPLATIPTDFETEIPHELNLDKGSERSKEVAAKIKKFYFKDEKPSQSNIDQVYLLKSDTQFCHGIHRSICEQKLKSDAPIYLYRMSLDTPINYYKRISTSKAVTLLFFFYYLCYKSGEGKAKSVFMKMANSIPRISPSGVCHADDLGYLFKSFISLKLEPGSLEELSMKRFVKLWTNFAKTSNPTPDPNDQLLGVEWKPVTKEENHFLEIDKELKVASNPDAERMQFWDSIFS